MTRIKCLLVRAAAYFLRVKKVQPLSDNTTYLRMIKEGIL